MDPMIGMIFMVPWNWAPLNYQLCQGQTLTVQQYEALFSLTGATFGGNGSTNFVLPNLQGRAPVGTGSLNGSYYTLGLAVGSQATTLSVSNIPVHNHAATFTGIGGGGSGSGTASGSVTLAVTGTAASSQITGTIAPKALSTQTTGGQGLPSSSNNAVGRATATSTNFYAPNASDVALENTNVTFTAPSTAVTGSATGNVTLPVTGGGGGITGGSVTIGVTGSGTPFSTMQPSLALSFIIAVNGIYPDRPN